jgi:hypothetical protein
VAERKEPELIETRLISGRGLFEVPPNDNYRFLWLYVSLKREPRINFGSSKYNPDKSEYGKITWIRDSYVMRSEAITFEEEVFFWDKQESGYIGTALTCMYESIVGYLDYLAPYLGAAPLPSDPLNRIWIEPIDNIPTEIKIVTRGTSLLQCKLYSLEYDVACPEAEPSPKPPPSPPPSLPLPIPEQIEVSPPYEYPNDNGDTVPSDQDSVPPPPPPPIPDGSLWQVTYLATLFNGTTRTQVRTWQYPYDSPIIGGTANSSSTVRHSGTPGSPFVSLGYTSIAVSVSPGANPPPNVITNIQVISEVQIS